DARRGGPPLPQPEDGRVPPHAHLPQARDPLALGTRAPHGATRGRPRSGGRPHRERGLEVESDPDRRERTFQLARSGRASIPCGSRRDIGARIVRHSDALLAHETNEVATCTQSSAHTPVTPTSPTRSPSAKKIFGNSSAASTGSRPTISSSSPRGRPRSASSRTRTGRRSQVASPQLG